MRPKNYKELNSAYVYRHIRLDKNEVFYIGIGYSNNYYRAYEKLRRNKIWRSIVAKTEYDVEIIIDNLTWEQACDKEKELIDLYGRKDNRTGTLANMTVGGEGAVGVVITEQTRNKLREIGKNKKLPSLFTRKGLRNSKEHTDKMIATRALTPFPEEFKNRLRTLRSGHENSYIHSKKISEGQKGKRLTPEHVLKITRRDRKAGDINKNKPNILNTNYKGKVAAYKNNVLIGVYNGVIDCAKSLALNSTRISRFIRGDEFKLSGYNGYLFIRELIIKPTFAEMLDNEISGMSLIDSVTYLKRKRKKYRGEKLRMIYDKIIEIEPSFIDNK